MWRFFQFRLSTVLMFIAMCAIALGWWKDQRDLRGELTDLRGKVNAFNAEMDERIEDVLRATDPAEASVAYRNLFAVAGSAGLRRLILDRRDGIGIQSLWEWVHRGLPEDNDDTRGRPNSQRFKEFLVILQERAGTKLPTWWVTIVRDLELDQQNRFSVLNLRNTPTSNMWPVVTPDRSYVANDGGETSPYDLKCQDRTSGKTLWKADVWAVNWQRPGGKYLSNGRVTVIEQEGRVVVFGAAFRGVYLEVFRRDDGSNLFRFSSAY